MPHTLVVTLVTVCLALAWLPRSAAAMPGEQWPEGNWFCAYGPEGPRCANPWGAGDLRETPHMKLGIDAAPWLPGIVPVLQGNRPPAYRPETVALISGEQGAQYLVVHWTARRSLARPPPVEFHKVIRGADGRRRFKWLRNVLDEDTNLSPLSGRVLFEDEPPVVVVNLSGGGSAPYTRKVRLIQLKRNSVDITPDWAGRTVNVVDLDGDGRFEVVTDNDHLIARFGSRVNGPYLPTVLTRVGGRFVYDCRRFRPRFERWSGHSERFAIEERLAHTERLAWLAEAFLGFLQVGAFEDARRVQGRIVSLAEERSPRNFGGYPPKYFTAEQIEEDLAAVLDWAMAHPEQDCPASANANPGGPNGTLIRLDLFLSLPLGAASGQ